MLFKEFDSKQETRNKLKNLLKSSNSEKQKALISKDLNTITNGIESEKQNAYYIDFYLKDSEHLIVLHDIRLEHNGRTAQIDHMIIHRMGIELLESKSFKGMLTINDDCSLDVNYNGNIKSFPNPIEQSKRHADVLKSFIEENADFGKRIDLLGGFDIKNIVLIHPETTISNKKLPKNFFRADTYISKRREDIDNLSVLKMFKIVSKMTNIDTVMKLAELIKNAHKPIEFNYENKYKISELKKENIEKIENKINIKIQKPKQQLNEGDNCPFCSNKLVLRKNKNNVSFLGCSSFPKCRFSRTITKISI